FTDPKVGMVQARWDHINRDHSLLTRGQAIFLDGHFMIEKTARNRSGRFVNFSGTAGLWRRQAIIDAGGWQHDTLTEDLDLSYRAQLAGWQFVFLPDVISPAELPPEMNAFKHQQHRWTKGTAQTCVKLLPKILRSNAPLRVKVEAWFHLTGCFTYLLMVALTLMLFPAFLIKQNAFGVTGRVLSTLIDIGLFLLATCSATTFYLCSQREIYRSWRDKIKYLPFLMSLGIGISLNNAKAVLEVLFRKQSEFVRTPKFGASSSSDQAWKKQAAKIRQKINWMPLVEFLFGCYVAVCIYMSITEQAATGGVRSVRLSLPFLCMFMFGYFYVSLTTILSRARKPAAAPTPVPAKETVSLK
ncbi:MAG: glycosyltransferase family 2 protein, partial [Phycisphaerae bacterium]|nr:glycosyltransferase family 2 protein [Phycisphaerae bacterium]